MSAPEAPPPLPGAAAGGIAAPPPVHAMHHRTQSTRTYPCRTCGGQLVFSPGQQRLECPSCKTPQDLAEVVGAVEEQDLQTALDRVRQGRPDREQATTGEKEVVCQSCGGHLTFTGTLTAQRCPSCATPIQLDGVHDAPDRLAVDGVVPFTVDEAAARAALDEWIGSRWFAPGEFKQYGRGDAFTSVYTSWFTYDAEATTSYTGERGDTHTETVNAGRDDERTVTRTEWHRVSGTVFNAFDDVLVLANDGIDAGLAAEAGPWPTDQAKPFSAEFLAGHTARTYDRDVAVCLVDAKAAMEQQIESSVRRDIGGDQQRIHSQQTTWGAAMTYKHVLLPLWMLTVHYDDRVFQVMVNGATGAVVGERPYSKVKVAAAVLAVLVVIAVIAVVATAS